MGNIFCSNNAKYMKMGKQVRQELYSRVNAKKEKYRQAFNSIKKQKKYKVIISSATQLVQMLENGETTSQQLVLIFVERAATIGIENNYVLDQLFDEAIEKAKQCDKIRAQNKDKKNWKGDPRDKSQCFPPFYGIPASYKQNFGFIGRKIHIGYVIPPNPIPTEHQLFVELTLQMGFIPFVRTNVPQSCKTIQTNNHMFGYCKNAWDNTRSCGGSSGGEGGIVGAHCSPIGFGTDIGGSLRIPAQWNGLCTLKAAGRYSKMGNCYYGKFSGGTTIKAELGPITRNISDLILFSKYIYDQESYKTIPKRIADPYLSPKAFNSQIFDKKPKLKVGYLIDLKTLTCSKSHQRATRHAAQLMQQQGHQIKQIQMPNFEKLYFFMVQLFASQGMSIFDQIRGKQPYIKQLKTLELINRTPWLIRRVIMWLIKKKHPRLAQMLKFTKPLSVKETFEIIYDTQTTLHREIYHHFIDNQIDVLLMPGFAFPSPKLGTVNKLQYCFSYASGWNVIHYPVGSMPITIVRSGQQQFKDKFNDSITKVMNENMKESKGMPVGIQIAALPFKQQQILYVMDILQKKVKFRQLHKCPILSKH